MGLGYLTIAYLARWQGLDVLGEYLFHLNSVIILGTLASMGLPTIVQRLGAQLNGTQIQIATWIMVRRQWLNMIGIAGVGSFTILMLNKDQRLTLFSGGQLGLSAFSFALFLVLLETIRISRGHCCRRPCVMSHDRYCYWSFCFRASTSAGPSSQAYWAPSASRWQVIPGYLQANLAWIPGIASS